MSFSPSLTLACTLAALACTACAPLPPQLAAPPPPPPEPTVVYVPSMAPEDLAARQLLNYQVVLSKMPPPDLAREIGKLTENPQSLSDTMKLALALGYTHVSSDVIRAQGLLDKILLNNTVDAQAWHGLARLLSASYAEQRRVEDQLDRLGQLLRDTQKDHQRKLDQLNEKLEALKSIERSLNSRAPAAPGPFISAPLNPAPPAAPSAIPKPASKP